MSEAAKNLKPDSQQTVKSKTAPVFNRRILIVDDEPAIAEGIRALLSPEVSNVVPFRRSSRSAPAPASAPTAMPNSKSPTDYELTVVHDPQAALDAVKESLAEGRPFAMGFFDVLMGADIDGIELVKQLQSLDSNLFAVFVTAYQDRSVDSINEYLGEDKSDRWDYINKPFTDGEIIQKARNITSLWNLQRMKEWHEEQLADAQRMLLQNERANTVAAVGRSVAHEFGNLLMQIVGHAELAVLKNEPQRMKEALETILKASDTASSVLGRFKKLAQGGVTGSEHKLVQILQPLEEALDLMGYQFKKCRIQVQKEKWEQILLEANRHSLVQVFMNVFINATHAMPQGGQLDLSVGKLDQDTIEISIRDHGPGIPTEILPRVTEALFTTKGSQGSGLGLAICKEIIEIEHGGEFVIENHPQGGALVRLRLPTRQEGNHGKHDEA
ncbi:MAG: ATP-binding protein [Pseudobdellovibrionaceae bacterium]